MPIKMSGSYRSRSRSSSTPMKFDKKTTVPKIMTTTVPINDKVNIDDKPTKSISNSERPICASIRSSNEPHLRCSLKAKNNEKYCALHLAQKNIMDYSFVEDDILYRDENFMEEHKPEITNPIIKSISIAEKNKPKPVIIKPNIDKKTNTIMHEQKASTIENSHKENEDDLEIKLLILVNDDEHYDKITELIGPVFNDVTIAEDQQDPVTYDPIWEYNSKGEKIPASVNKYYLFSYIDSKDKVRCLTIFTIYNMIQNDNYVHPITMEPIADVDIDRAKELINIYSTKIGLFKEADDSAMSKEFKLKNRLTKLFKQFHTHSIYFEETWLTSITDKQKLYKIITETEKLVSNNIKTINPNLHGFKIFQKRQVTKRHTSIRKPSKYSSKIDDDDDNDDDSVMALQEYIVNEWERLIQSADTPQNQMPIWILASGLSFVVPDVKQKYPDLEIML